MNKPLSDTYPNRIKIFRQRLGIAQTELAKALGITQPTLSDLENGKTRLDAERANVLGMLLRCAPWELADDLAFLKVGQTHYLLNEAKELQPAGIAAVPKPLRDLATMLIETAAKESDETFLPDQKQRALRRFIVALQADYDDGVETTPAQKEAMAAMFLAMSLQ